MTATLKITNLQNESSVTPNIVLNADGTTTIPTQSTTNLSYTGTLTGGTGVINIGSGQVYKDASGNVGIGTASPVSLFHVNSASASAIATVQSTTFALFRSKNASRSVDYGSDGTGGYIDIGNAPFRFFNGATQAMTLDASGNLGIGTASMTSFYSGGSQLVVGNGASSRGISIYTGTTGEGGIYFGDGLTGSDTIRGQVVYTHSSNAMYFCTDATERLRLDASGNLLVGTTTDGFGGILSTKIHVVSSGSRSGVASKVDSIGSAASFVAWNAADSGTRRLISFYSNSSITSVGEITSNGTNTTYSTTSDYRLKENVLPMTGALAKVAALKPCTYTWKADGSAGQGFIAHELQAVVPDAVTGEKDAVDADGNPKYQGVDTSFLVATLTAALQEQQAIITQLQADVAALKGAA